MKKSNLQKNRGYLLLEILISVGLFTLVVTISLGAILTVLDSNRKAHFNKDVLDGLNLAIEDMVRTISFGNNYHCGTVSPLSSPRNCPDNTPSGGDTQMAVLFKGATRVYRLNNGKLEYSADGGSNYQVMTSDNVTIQHLKFYVFNTAVGDIGQPYAIIVMRGYAGNKPSNQTYFDIQTTVSQRGLDL